MSHERHEREGTRFAGARCMCVCVCICVMWHARTHQLSDAISQRGALGGERGALGGERVEPLRLDGRLALRAAQARCAKGRWREDGGRTGRWEWGWGRGQQRLTRRTAEVVASAQRNGGRTMAAGQMAAGQMAAGQMAAGQMAAGQSPRAVRRAALLPRARRARAPNLRVRAARACTPAGGQRARAPARLRARALEAPQPARLRPRSPRGVATRTARAKGKGKGGRMEPWTHLFNHLTHALLPLSDLGGLRLAPRAELAGLGAHECELSLSRPARGAQGRRRRGLARRRLLRALCARAAGGRAGEMVRRSVGRAGEMVRRSVGRAVEMARRAAQSQARARNGRAGREGQTRRQPENRCLPPLQSPQRSTRPHRRTAHGRGDCARSAAQGRHTPSSERSSVFESRNTLSSETCAMTPSCWRADKGPAAPSPPVTAASFCCACTSGGRRAAGGERRAARHPSATAQHSTAHERTR